MSLACYPRIQFDQAEKPMRRINHCITVAGILLVVGCASQSKPIIDTAGVDMAQYDQDVAECEDVAQQVDSKAGSSAARGGVIGGVIGAIVGDSSTALKSAGVGAVMGGAKGDSATQKERAKVVKNCLRNRGYQILN